MATHFSKPQPSESDLVGDWVTGEDRIVRGDDVENRIEWLTASYLRRVATSAESGGWDSLFQDPEDGRYWERTFPQGEMQGGGPRRLRVMSAIDARTKYGIPGHDESGGEVETRTDPDDPTIEVDLSNANFDDFVRFWFDRPIDPRAMKPSRNPDFAWYRHIKIRFEPRQYAESFIRLFNAPEFLLDKYSKDQLDVGFWAMMSPMVSGGIEAAIWSEQLSWEVRERLVRSMYQLFARLFAREPLESASFMWWNLLTDAVGMADEFPVPDVSKMAKVMFGVLCQILNVEARPCQEAALHGLNHLEDPGTESVVTEWLARHPMLDRKLLEYAESCRVFRSA